MTLLHNVASLFLRFAAFVIQLFGKVGFPVVSGFLKSHTLRPDGTCMHTSCCRVNLFRSTGSRKSGKKSLMRLSLTFVSSRIQEPPLPTSVSMSARQASQKINANFSPAAMQVIDFFNLSENGAE